jgi:hypothetical protein
MPRGNQKGQHCKWCESLDRSRSWGGDPPHALLLQGFDFGHSPPPNPGSRFLGGAEAVVQAARTPPPPSGRPASTGEVGCGRGGSAGRPNLVKRGRVRSHFFWILRIATNCFWSGESRGNCVPFLLLFTHSSSFLLVSRLSKSGVGSAFIADRYEKILTATHCTGF